MDTQKNIKFKHIITSGLLAGLLILIIGAGLFPILGNQMDEILESRGVSPMGTGSMVFFASISLVNGIAIVWIYAFIENRFKSKLKAIIIVSVSFWFFTYFLSNSALVAYGFMPLSFVAIGTIWGLLELFIAALVGAKLYNKVKGD